MEIYLQRNFDTLVPADEQAATIIKSMKHGQAIKVKYSFPRNYENHKRFFAFLKTTYDMQEHFQHIEHYRKWIVMKTGRYSIIKAPNGFEMFDCNSISFSSMDETEFRAMFSDCIDAFLSVWGDRVSREELERIIDFS